MNTPTAWARLPNAAHIDWVLASLAAHPGKWGAAWGAARGAAWDAAWGAARGAAWDAAWGAARDAAWGAARDAAWGAARDAAWGAARGALFALVAWDECASLLEAPPDALKVLIAASHHPAILLYPACIARANVTTL